MGVARRGVWLLTALLLVTGCAGGPGTSLDRERAAAANADLGIEYLRNGDNVRAVRKLEKALEYDSRHVNAHWALAIAHERLNEPEAADRHYRRAIDIQERPEILNSYGVFLCQRDRPEAALERFERAVSDPSYPAPADALANAGLCLARVGDREGAESYFRRALERNAQHRPTLAAMARASLERGDHLKARGFFQRLEATAGPRTPLVDEWLLLGARIETALGDRSAASAYLERYNDRNPGAPRTLDELDDDT